MNKDKRKENSKRRLPPSKEPSPQDIEDMDKMAFIYAAIACKPDKPGKDQWWTCIDRGYWVNI